MRCRKGGPMQRQLQMWFAFLVMCLAASPGVLGLPRQACEDLVCSQDEPGGLFVCIEGFGRNCTLEGGGDSCRDVACESASPMPDPTVQAGGPAAESGVCDP